jgi:hypothetical protein
LGPARGRNDEVALLEGRLGVELLFGQIERDRVALRRCVREHVLADDHVATQQAGGADHEPGDASGLGIDEHPVDLARVVPVARPDSRVQIDAHRVSSPPACSDSAQSTT